MNRSSTDNRIPIEAGSVLVLGAVQYHIRSLMGRGASVLVYDAVYTDTLNENMIHHVLIKELYPLYRDGMITRLSSGEISWISDADHFMEERKYSFRKGNEINLGLLIERPSEISGNLNSFEAYGTYYSVLTVHDGITMRTWMDQHLKEDHSPDWKLSEAVSVLLNILDALEGFHQQKLLHLDLSPDNIILMEKQAMLIDYNSVWDWNSDSDFRSFSYKFGYTAPEIYNHEIKEIGYSTDLYSVGAIFFELISGKQYDLEQEGYHHFQQQSLLSPAGSLRSEFVDFEHIPLMLKDAPEPVISKVLFILKKSLHILPGRRYQDISSYSRDLLELQDRISGRGITHSAIWEAGRRSFRLYKEKLSQGYISRKIVGEDGQIYSLSELMLLLTKGQQFILKGPGGIGKTRLMLELWGKSLRRYRSHSPVFLYISLKEYKESGREKDYLRWKILHSVCKLRSSQDYDQSLFQLETFLDHNDQEESVSMVLLLDGFNEAGDHREALIDEMNYLKHFSGLGMMVSLRSDTELQAEGLSGRSLELLPIEKDHFMEYLAVRKIPLPQDERFCQLLGNPLILDIYTKSCQLDQNAETSCDSSIRTADDLFLLYLRQLLARHCQVHASDSASRLNVLYIMDHLLPEIAYLISQKSVSILSEEELLEVTEKNYMLLFEKTFCLTYREFMGQSRVMYADIHNSAEWFHYAVHEILMDEMKLIVRTEQGYYSLIHDNFLDPLVNIAVEHHKSYHRRKKISAKTILLCGLTFCVISLVAGCVLWKKKPWIAKITACGNSNANMYNRDRFALMDNQYEYFVDTDGSLWSCEYDEDNQSFPLYDSVRIKDESGRDNTANAFLNVGKDKLYFVHFGNTEKDEICSMNFDGSGLNSLFSLEDPQKQLDYVNYASLSNGKEYLYYLYGDTDQDGQLEKGTVCRYDLAKKKQEDLLPEDVSWFNIYDRYIYYIKEQDDQYLLYRSYLDGSSPKLLDSEHDFLSGFVEDDRMFLLSFTDDNDLALLSCDLDGKPQKNEEGLYGFDLEQTEIGYDNGWIYYSVSGKKELHKVRSNGLSDEMLVKGYDFYSFSCYDNYIYAIVGEQDADGEVTVLENDLISSDGFERHKLP